MFDLQPGWREALAEEASQTLENLPDSMKPMRERPRYEPPAELPSSARSSQRAS